MVQVDPSAKFSDLRPVRSSAAALPPLWFRTVPLRRSRFRDGNAELCPNALFLPALHSSGCLAIYRVTPTDERLAIPGSRAGCRARPGGSSLVSAIVLLGGGGTHRGATPT